MNSEQMDRTHGYEIITVEGKQYWRGAGTDWCCYPVHMISWAKKLIKEKEQKRRAAY